MLIYYKTPILLFLLFYCIEWVEFRVAQNFWNKLYTGGKKFFGSPVLSYLVLTLYIQLLIIKCFGCIEITNNFLEVF